MAYSAPIEEEYDMDWYGRGVHMPEGFMSFKDDGIEECEMFCGPDHDTHLTSAMTLKTLLRGDGPFVREAEYYLRTGNL